MARQNQLPAIDLEVYFDFGQSQITTEGAKTLRLLGQALSDPRFAGARFVIAGHTDAKGPAAFNLALSQARAEAVRRWLIANFRLPPQSLIARGFGSTQLKDPANPEGDQNRRVQVINWTAQSKANPPASPRRQR